MPVHKHTELSTLIWRYPSLFVDTPSKTSMNMMFMSVMQNQSSKDFHTVAEEKRKVIEVQNMITNFYQDRLLLAFWLKKKKLD